MYFEDAIYDILSEARTIFIERHKKYGPGDLTPVNVLYRINDKLIRLKRYYGLDAAMKYETLWDYAKAVAEGKEVPPPKESADETITDTILDLINYCVILEMLRRGYWGLPMKGDERNAG